MCYAFEDSKYGKEATYSTDIVSKTAYLLGVMKKNFGIDEPEDGKYPFDKEVYAKLDKNKNYRIVRNLCILRNDFLRNRKKIYTEMSMDLRTIYDIELIHQDALKALDDDGQSIYKPNTIPDKYIIKINELLKCRICNIKALYPEWISFDFVKDMFLMPNGTTTAGVSAAAYALNSNPYVYPYQRYINWRGKELGNILKNDFVFLRDLYSSNGTAFYDDDKVKSAPEEAKADVVHFLERNNKTEIIVDCENSDPYMLHSFIGSIPESGLEKISKVILIDDEHTTSAWECIKNVLPNVEIEHKLIRRVLQGKSLVDISLATQLTREIYRESIDSFILCSSDSDFYGMIDALRGEVNWLVMIERGQTAEKFKAILKENSIWYAYLDDYGSGTSNIKTITLLKESRRYISERLQPINLKEMLNAIDVSSKTALSGSEWKNFYNKYLAKARLTINNDGDLAIELGA